MKTILFLILLSSSAVIGQTMADKTKRMVQIEKKFNMVMVLIEGDKGTKFWLFKSEYKDGVFGFVPVMVKADATDKEVASAIIASTACASFYDEVAKKAAQERQSQQSQQSPMLYQ